MTGVINEYDLARCHKLRVKVLLHTMPVAVKVHKSIARDQEGSKTALHNEFQARLQSEGNDMSHVWRKMKSKIPTTGPDSEYVEMLSVMFNGQNSKDSVKSFERLRQLILSDKLSSSTKKTWEYRELRNIVDGSDQQPSLYDVRAVQDFLEMIAPGDDSAVLMMQILMNQFDKSRLKEPLIVYRGMSGISQREIDRIVGKDGSTISFDRFTSTSVDLAVAASTFSDYYEQDEFSYLMEIKLPTGTRASAISTGDDYDREREMLLAPDQKYKVVSVNHNTRIVTLIAIP